MTKREILCCLHIDDDDDVEIAVIVKSDYNVGAL